MREEVNNEEGCKKSHCVDYVNRWVQLYPEEHRQDIIGRLSKPAKYSEAFIELFIFILFSHLGFSVTIHPDIDGDSHHPDFLMTKGDNSFYLEVKVDNNKSDEERSRNQQKEKMMNVLSNMKNPGQGVILRGFNILDRDKPEPSTKGLIRDIGLEAANRKQKTGFTEDLFENSDEEMEFNSENLSCSYSFFSLTDKLRELSKPSIIDASFKGGTVNYHKTLLESIQQKASKYNLQGKPYIICIYEMCPFVDEFGIAKALLGDEQLNLGFNKDRELVSQVMYRIPNGFFTSEPKPHVGAVLIFGPHLDRTEDPLYWFFINEDADNSIPYEELPFSYYKVCSQGCTYVSERRSISNIVMELRSMNSNDLMTPD